MKRLLLLAIFLMAGLGPYQRTEALELRINGKLNETGWTKLFAVVISDGGDVTKQLLAEGSYSTFDKTFTPNGISWGPELDLIKLRVESYNNNADKSPGDGDVWWDCIGFEYVQIRARQNSSANWTYLSPADNYPGYMVPNPAGARDKGYSCANTAKQERPIYPKP